MKPQKPTESKPVQALRAVALSYPEAEEGTSCKNCAFKARGKAFLFVGTEEDSYSVMLKLGESLSEAARLERKEPGRCKVGAHGWVKVTFGRDEFAPHGVLEGWIDESYRLLAHKDLAAKLPPRAAPAAGGKKRK